MEKITVYYVDDDSEDLQYFAEAAAHLDKNIALFNVGFDMMTAMKTPPHPAIVFLDLNMPQITGFEILKYIKNSSGYRDLPVIILSTSNNIRDIDISWDLGASYYIVKSGLYKEFQQSLEYAIGTDWDTNPRDREKFVHKSNTD